MREYTNVAHSMTGRIEALEIDCGADLHYIPGTNAAIQSRYAICSIFMCNDRGAGRGYHRPVATGMVAVLVSIQDLRYCPAVSIGRFQAFRVVERINRQGIASFFAGNQVIEVSEGVTRPYLFNNQDFSPMTRISGYVDTILSPNA